jgi:FKBP-type peptidyl-prolyl cis-trans isomerase FklB
MKKLSFLMTAIIAIAVMSSCTAQSGSSKADLKTDVDSLSYAAGMLRTQGLLPYLEQSGIDSTVMADFIKGLHEGAAISKDDKKKTAYVMGLQIGQQVGGQMLDGFSQQIFQGDTTQTLSKNNFVAGFVAGALNKDMKMSMDDAQVFAEAKMESIRSKSLEKEYGANKEAGEKFLAENKGKEGIVTLPSGLQYKIVTEGKGAVPTTSDRVKVNYAGTLIDGTEFDSSYKRGEPAVFGTTQVIKGWTEALTLMPVGSKWMLYIPQDLAYGSMNQGQITPFSTLIFEVELLDNVQ